MIPLSPSERILYSHHRPIARRAEKSLLDDIRSERPTGAYENPGPPECQLHVTRHTGQRGRPLSLPQFRLIVALRRKGWKLKAIGWEVCRSEGFVCSVLKNKKRIEERFMKRTGRKAV